MKPSVTSDCSLAPKLLFVDWLKILANEKQAVQFRSPIVLVCERKRCSHMPFQEPPTYHEVMPTMHYFIDPCLMYFTAKNQIEISFP